LRVEAVSVAGTQREAAEALQVGVLRHDLDEPLAESLPSRFFENIDVTEVRERSAVRDHASEAYLALLEEPEAERAEK
jgi:hypothetical protein